MIDIKIDKDIVYVDAEKDGRRFKKVTDLKTFRETVGVVEKSYDSGWLPGKTGVKRIIEDSTSEKVVYIHPGGRKTIRLTDSWYPYYQDEHGYTEEDYERVGYPRVEGMDDDDYYEYILNRWRSILDKLYAEGNFPKNQLYDVMVPDAILIGSKIDGANHWRIRLFTLGFNTLLTGREFLYEYPAPNIYSGDGRICWGEDEFDTNFEGIQPFQGYFPSFISSSFNSDLSGGRINSDYEITTIWRRMDRMLKDGHSEEEVLKEYEGILRRTSHTIDSFI